MCTGFDCLLQILTNYWNLVILSLQGSGTKRQVYVYRQYLKKTKSEEYFSIQTEVTSHDTNYKLGGMQKCSEPVYA